MTKYFDHLMKGKTREEVNYMRFFSQSGLYCRKQFATLLTKLQHINVQLKQEDASTDKFP